MADEQVIRLLEAVAKTTPEESDLLRDLDSKIGDGDLGETIILGFRAVLKALPDLAGREPSDQIARAGMAFNRAAASTFGVLFATALMRAGQSVKGKAVLGARDVPAMGRAAVEGMMQRGKAKLGDKTLLDALVPAIDAFERAVDEGEDGAAALAAAVEACDAGVDETTGMRAKVSRAGWLGERTVGVPDPGATAVLLMLRAAVPALA